VRSVCGAHAVVATAPHTPIRQGTKRSTLRKSNHMRAALQRDKWPRLSCPEGLPARDTTRFGSPLKTTVVPVLSSQNISLQRADGRERLQTLACQLSWPCAGQGQENDNFLHTSKNGAVHPLLLFWAWDIPCSDAWAHSPQIRRLQHVASSACHTSFPGPRFQLSGAGKRQRCALGRYHCTTVDTPAPQPAPEPLPCAQMANPEQQWQV
jgi:hypothetical protein